MKTEQPLLCPACGRPPEHHVTSAGNITGIHTVRCITEGCQFGREGIGRNEENAVKSWNEIVKWTKEKYQI